MRSLVILPAFLATFAGAVLIIVWALTATVSPDMNNTAPGAGLTGTPPENPASIAIDEAQY